MSETTLPSGSMPGRREGDSDDVLRRFAAGEIKLRGRPGSLFAAPVDIPNGVVPFAEVNLRTMTLTVRTPGLPRPQLPPESALPTVHELMDHFFGPSENYFDVQIIAKRKRVLKPERLKLIHFLESKVWEFFDKRQPSMKSMIFEYCNYRDWATNDDRQNERVRRSIRDHDRDVEGHIKSGHDGRYWKDPMWRPAVDPADSR